MFFVEFKKTKIQCYRGSNWVYINGRPFDGLRSAKIWITKNEKITKLKKEVETSKAGA